MRRHVAVSPAASLAAFPVRVKAVVKHDWRTIEASVSWLVRSREHTNLTYDLTPLNTRHLEWFAASVTGRPVSEVRQYVAELVQNTELRSHIKAKATEGSRRRLTDPDARYGRRLGWYVLVRALRPNRVIETGTDKGLGSLVLAEALLQNGSGRLFTIDTNPQAGFLIGGKWASVIDQVQGDSHEVLRSTTDAVDLFLHDSLHTYEYEMGEFHTVEPLLTEGAMVLSDNATETSALMDWAEERGWRFAFFQEEPARHWYRGDGIGVAYR